MADHPRKIIRAAIAALIKGAAPQYATAAGRAVYDSRDMPLGASQLPAVLIYTTRERIESDQMADGGIRRRAMDVSVECFDTGENAAVTVDALAWSAENLLRANPNLGGLVEWVNVTDTRIVVVEDAELALFCAALTVEVTYCTHAADEPGLPGYPPSEVLLGFAPEVGMPHKDDYSPVTA